MKSSQQKSFKKIDQVPRNEEVVAERDHNHNHDSDSHRYFNFAFFWLRPLATSLLQH